MKLAVFLLTTAFLPCSLFAEEVRVQIKDHKGSFVTSGCLVATFGPSKNGKVVQRYYLTGESTIPLSHIPVNL